MIAKSKELTEPAWNATIWRYMGLDKLIDLILSSSLFFTNSSKLTDKYEGGVPRKNLESAEKLLGDMSATSSDLDRALSDHIRKYQSYKDLTLVNCWSINPSESYALWKIYLGGSKSGVALKSNVKNLKEAINKGNDSFDEDIYIGKVSYTDFIPKTITRQKVITTKNPFYEFENELRLFILHERENISSGSLPYDIKFGRSIKVDLDTLINKIYLSPFAGPWFEETFKNLIKKIKPSFLDKVIISDIQDE